MKQAKDAGATLVTDVTPLFLEKTSERYGIPGGNFWWIHERTKEIGWPEMEKRMHD